MKTFNLNLSFEITNEGIMTINLYRAVYLTPNDTTYESSWFTTETAILENIKIATEMGYEYMYTDRSIAFVK